jgi:hypothetical protein
MASLARTILAMSLLLLLLPPLALGSLAGGDQRRKEPWIATICEQSIDLCSALSENGTFW